MTLDNLYQVYRAREAYLSIIMDGVGFYLILGIVTISLILFIWIITKLFRSFTMPQTEVMSMPKLPVRASDFITERSSQITDAMLRILSKHGLQPVSEISISYTHLRDEKNRSNFLDLEISTKLNTQDYRAASIGAALTLSGTTRSISDDAMSIFSDIGPIIGEPTIGINDQGLFSLKHRIIWNPRA